MNELQIFKDSRFGEIRVSVNGTEPMFCLADICKVLELTTPSKVKDRLNQKGMNSIHTLTKGGMQSMTYINEANLYKCIFQSRKPEAEAFQDWVCEDVLPSIRQHGIYGTPATIDQMISDPEFGIKLLTQLREEREAKELAQKDAQEKTMLLASANDTITRQAPKVDYYDNVLMSTDTLTTTQIAKSIGRSGKWLNKKLRECGLIFFQSGQWLLKSPYDRWNLHKVRTASFTRSDGTQSTKSSTVWTERGRRLIVALNDCGFVLTNAIHIIKGEMQKGGTL